MECQTLWVPLSLPLWECMHSIPRERKEQRTARQWLLKPHSGTGEIFGYEQLNYFVTLATNFILSRIPWSTSLLTLAVFPDSNRE